MIRRLQGCGSQPMRAAADVGGVGGSGGFPEDEAGDGGPFYLDEFMLYS